jgi:hypothetical protein
MIIHIAYLLLEGHQSHAHTITGVTLTTMTTGDGEPCLVWHRGSPSLVHGALGPRICMSKLALSVLTTWTTTTTPQNYEQ